MNTTLIIARMDPTSADEVADIFADSDGGELPHLVGVRRRELYTFHDVYVHLFETDDDARRLDGVRDNPLFRDIDRRLAAHITAYDPASWRSPADAMARRFYRWAA